MLPYNMRLLSEERPEGITSSDRAWSPTTTVAATNHATTNSHRAMLSARRSAGRPEPTMVLMLRHVFLDFDGTLTVTAWLPRLNRHALSDDVAKCSQMSDAEILANFGGSERVASLHRFLGALRQRGVTLFVLSHGQRVADGRQARQAGLPVGRGGGTSSP